VPWGIEGGVWTVGDCYVLPSSGWVAVCQRLGVLAAVALAAWGVVKIVALCVWGCPGVFAPCLNSAQLRAAELRGVELTAPVDCTALSAQA
jgi:hypothetical protein